MQPPKIHKECSATMVDLAIAYRVYPSVSATPALHADDKLKLVELCLRSFRRALGSLRIKIWVLLDGCPPVYEELFRAHFREEEIEVIPLTSAGNAATFAMQVNLLASQSVADLVYFAEDDYFYLPNAIVDLVEFMRSGSNIDFATPYDHPDCYDSASRNERHLVRAFGVRHWRTASSTCLTFLATRAALLENRSHFNGFRRGSDDCAIWQAITQKSSLFDFRIHAASSERFRIWIKTWLRGYRRIVFGRSYKLWAPLPSVATHMALPCLAPLIDWYTEFDRFQIESSTAAMADPSESDS